MLQEGAAVSGGQLLFQKCLVINEDLAYSKILDWTNESCLKATGKSLVKITCSWEISVPKGNKSDNSKDYLNKWIQTGSSVTDVWTLVNITRAIVN